MCCKRGDNVQLEKGVYCTVSQTRQSSPETLHCPLSYHQHSCGTAALQTSSNFGTLLLQVNSKHWYTWHWKIALNRSNLKTQNTPWPCITGSVWVQFPEYWASTVHIPAPKPLHLHMYISFIKILKQLNVDFSTATKKNLLILQDYTQYGSYMAIYLLVIELLFKIKILPFFSILERNIFHFQKKI